MNLLLYGGTICTFDEHWRVLHEGVLGISGEYITFVGEDIPEGFHPDLSLDCSGCLIIPGLVNTHVHLGEQLLKGLMDEKDFSQLFYSSLFFWEAALEPELVYYGSLAGIADALRCGVTTFGDIYHYPESTARAVEVSGVRACIGQLIYGFDLYHPFTKNRSSIQFSKDAFEEQLSAALEFAKSWNGKANGRITTALGPHATNTLEAWMFERIADEAKRNSLVIHMHLAQMKAEYDEVMKRYGLSCVELLANTGILDCKFVGAHAIFIKPEEISILADSKAAIAHNPVANAKDAGLIAPVIRMVRAGVRVGLGTDAFHTNLLETARFAAYLHRVTTGDPSVCPAREVLYWATRGGALALGLEDVGVLEPGKRADLVVIDMGRLNSTPVDDPYISLLYYVEPSNIKFVIINGQIIVYNGMILTLNVKEIYKHFIRAINKFRLKIKK